MSKPLELVLRYGDIEATHVFDRLIDFDEVDWLAAYSGIPVDAELIGVIGNEIFLRLMTLELKEEVLLMKLDWESPILRGLAAELIRKLKQTPSMPPSP